MRLSPHLYIVLATHVHTPDAIQRQGAQLTDTQKMLVVEEKMNDPVGDRDAVPLHPKSKSISIYEHAKAKNLHAVKALLYQGVDANKVCPDKNYSSLIAAVYNGHQALQTNILLRQFCFQASSTQ